MKSILLITHDTSLTGAPKSILLVFEQLVLDGYSVTTVALKGGGKLEERFKRLSQDYYRLDIVSKKKSYTLSQRLKKKLFGIPIVSEYELVLNQISTLKFDYIYCNTIVCLSLGEVFKQSIGCNLVLHIHELRTVIDEFCPELHTYDNFIDLYIVPSELNKKCLSEDYNIPKDKIHLIRETTDFYGKGSKLKKSDSVINVLMCGGAYWRKGDDLFILIANTILKKDSRFRFFWVGYQSEERKRINEADIVKLGIRDFVFFINETEHPLNWYLQSDIFMLTSREDPFPLAAIEAGVLGLPIFCFDQATGISELIDNTCIIPYLDIEEMSKRILSSVKDNTYLEKLSNENKLLFSIFTPELISIEIKKILQCL